MFSRLTNAVENFVPPAPRRGSQDALSPHSPSSSGQIADAALANLRRTLGNQRSGSPSKHHGSPDQEMRTHKQTLEDRLKAKFAIGDASNSTTPAASARVSPAPPTGGALEHPLSPTSLPLPDSPALSPTQLNSVPTMPSVPLLAPSAEVHAPQPRPPAAELDAKPPVLQNNFEEPRHPEADIPLPVTAMLDSFAGDPQAEQSTPPEGRPASPSNQDGVDSLQQRLKLVEQRFTDVSLSFKRLQAEKMAADAILRELSPLQTIQDSSALRDFLQNVALKNETSQDEINRLNGKLLRQDERIEELRDTHRLESSSQSEQIERLRKQLDETEALYKASESSTLQSEEERSKHQAEVAQLRTELQTATNRAKALEEKCQKSIALLRTTREETKKAQALKEEALKEVKALKEREKADKDKDKADRAKLRHDIDVANAEREKALATAKVQFDNDIANMKDRFEKDVAALRGQYDLEAVGAKSAHAKELATKQAHISSLENSVNALSREKNDIFDELQLRQAELESSQSLLDSLRGQSTEHQYQLREANDRIALLTEELSDLRREQENNRSRGSNSSAEEVARLLSSTELKYEGRISDLKKDLSTLEHERNEGEAEWSRKLREKTREVDELKRLMDSSAKSRDLNDGTVNSLKDELEKVKAELTASRREIADLLRQSEQIKDLETSARLASQELTARTSAHEHQLEEYKSREAQLRASNKTLREELRKVQTSAALLEKQRNPGVGYWTARDDARTSATSSSTDLPSEAGSPRKSSSTPTPNDEEVNLEYLRNVILQFLEHKETRPNLVRVLSIILHFTPQETRRVIAKV